MSLSRQRLEWILREEASVPRFVEVAKKSQIPECDIIGVEIEGKSLALVKLEGAIYALVDNCPHTAGPLSDGQIIGDEIECPWHRSCFNVKTGRVTRDPATVDVATYTVRVVGDAVEVEI
jgi:nitrite reductase/ring-hydroxylating ferredoxin subunit